jgi:hypothetical protein
VWNSGMDRRLSATNDDPADGRLRDDPANHGFAAELHGTVGRRSKKNVTRGILEGGRCVCGTAEESAQVHVSRRERSDVNGTDGRRHDGRPAGTDDGARKIPEPPV